MPKFIKIERPDLNEFYIERPENLLGAIEGELLEPLEYIDNDEKILLTVIEMTEEEYKTLPEFTGW